MGTPTCQLHGWTLSAERRVGTFFPGERPSVISIVPMTTADLTLAQRELLRTLPDRVPIHRVDRLWIFTPHLGKTRETGIIVLSLLPDDAALGEVRELLTLRYVAEQVKDKLQLRETVTEEGWAPPERIDRVIFGVLERAGEIAGEPIEERLEGGPEAREEGWHQLVDRLSSNG